MNDKEVKKQLSEAKKYRNNGDFAESLAILHQINNEYPENVTYRYLLASTYYESMNTDAAQRYTQEAIALDSNFKQNYELLGDIYSKEGNLEKARENYEKAYQLDSQYLTVGEKLIQLYLKIKHYEGVVEVCNHMMSYIHVDPSTAKSRALTSIYLGCLLYKSWAQVYLKQYDNGIETIEAMKALENELKLPSYKHRFKNEDEALFKMYFKLTIPKKTEEYINILKSEYSYNEETIKKLEEEAQQDIILFRQRPEVMGYLGLN
jgi:tetratricopeptide (TPR) repeat protein